MTQPDSQPDSFDRLSRTQILVAMAVTAIILLLLAKLWMRLGTVTLLPIIGSVKAIVLGVGLGLGISLGSAVIYQIWPRYRQAADLYLTMVLEPLIWADIFWLGLLPGLSEELLFRGVMLSALGLTTVALVLSSICFGVLHLGNVQQWPYVIWASCIGGVLGYSAIATHNLLVPVVAHIVTNWVAGITWKWIHPHPAPLEGAGKG